ncbi:MAG: hypothetical protein LQ351_004910 [Letrouitia transgressa]|nr:MAG: hypothetical protein LQ351_004910 [Letrouitia transgressa]
MASLDIQLKNQTSSDQVFATITGLAIDNNNALFFLSSDGKTPYYPAQPAQDQAPLGQDVAIPLGSPGSTVAATVPHLAGSRIYFSIGKALNFALNRGETGPALVAPSVNNPSDPNIDTQWGFCEFTYNTSQLFCNISYVDFVGIPIALHLTTASSGEQNVTGIPADGISKISDALRAQGAADGQPWDKLIYAPNGGPTVRILSPNNAILTQQGLFNGYYEPYVQQVYSKYAAEPLSINTQNGDWGTVSGQVENGALTFNTSNGTFAYAPPSTADIFSCSTGPFARPNDESGNLGARIAAGFNRSTLLTSSLQPDDPAPEAYYQTDVPTNHYSRILHANNGDKLGYAFPYDDVTSANGQDQSGKVADGAPQVLTVTVGGGGGDSGASAKKELK